MNRSSVVFLILAGFVAAPTLRAEDVVKIPSCRLIDTRPGDPLPAATAVTLDVRGECLVPEEALGIIANLLVISPTSQGHLKLYGTEAAPDTSVLNYNTGETVVSGGATVWLSEDDENTSAYDPPAWGLKVFSLRETDFVLDITAYITRLPTVNYRGVITDTETGLAPPFTAHQLDTLAPPLSLICRMPWIDPEHCDGFVEDDEVCGVAHIETFGGTPELFVHTMTDCL